MPEDADTEVQDLTRSSPPPPLPTPTTVTTRSLRPRPARGQSSAQGSRASTSSSSRSRSHSTRGTPQSARPEASGASAQSARPVDAEPATLGPNAGNIKDSNVSKSDAVSGRKRNRRSDVAPAGTSSKKRKMAQKEQSASSTPSPDPPLLTTRAAGAFVSNSGAPNHSSSSDTNGDGLQALSTPASECLMRAEGDPREAFERMMAQTVSSSSEFEFTARIHSYDAPNAAENSILDPGVSSIGGSDAAAPAQASSRSLSSVPSARPSFGPSCAAGEEADEGPSPRPPEGHAGRALDCASTGEVEPLASYPCPICFSPPTYATITPCGHVLCGDCLFSAVKTTMQRGAYTLPASERMIARCPVCRAPIPGWDGRGSGVIGLRPRAVFSL